jgi:DNA-binding transcriptional MerR regulator
MTSGADPPDGPGALVDTSTAAESLRTSRQALDDWADAGLITPDRVTEDGTRRWDLHHLRRQIAAHLDPGPRGS